MEYTGPALTTLCSGHPQPERHPLLRGRDPALFGNSFAISVPNCGTKILSLGFRAYGKTVATRVYGADGKVG